MSDAPIEAAIVRCVSIGWEVNEAGENQFRAVVVFDAPPPWPIGVAFGKTPISMQPLPEPPV